MADLSTSYLGLKLRNPIIIASGPKTSNIESLKKCEQNGAGAVVLKSIFEEQIETEVGKQLVEHSEYLEYSDFSEYFENVSKDYYLEKYLQLLKDIQELPFNYSSCMLLHGLLNKTGAEIVLSSTWRLSSKHIESLEKYTGLKIKDKTPNLQAIRGEEIQQYLDEHKEITEYVILDDDSDMLPEQKGHFVKVDAKKGLTMRNIIDCEKKLKYGDCKWEG